MDKVRQAVLKRFPPKNLPLKPGDTVKVHVKVKEGDKERIQIFEGAVLKIQGRDISRSFTVRKISQGAGVEKTFPFASPALVKAEITGRAKVRRARLFYLRNRKGRAARLLSARFFSKEDEAQQPASAAADKAPVATAAPVTAETPAAKTSKEGAPLTEAAPAAKAPPAPDKK